MPLFILLPANQWDHHSQGRYLTQQNVTACFTTQPACFTRTLKWQNNRYFFLFFCTLSNLFYPKKLIGLNWKLSTKNGKTTVWKTTDRLFFHFNMALKCFLICLKDIIMYYSNTSSKFKIRHTDSVQYVLQICHMTSQKTKNDIIFYTPTIFSI